MSAVEPELSTALRHIDESFSVTVTPGPVTAGSIVLWPASSLLPLCISLLRSSVL